MIISLVGRHSRSLLDDFDTAGVLYDERHPQPGVIMNAGEWVEIASASIQAAGVVLAAWLHARNSRKVVLTMKDDKIEHLEGRSADEIIALLKVAKKIVAMETKKPDDKP